MRTIYYRGEYMTAKKKLLHIMDLSYIEKYHLNSSFLNKKIVIYNDRFSHIDKHKLEFSSIDEYNNAVNNIETIIKDPDFISIESSGRSIQFIKTLKDNVLVAARLSIGDELKIKTLFPINKTKMKKLYDRCTYK